MPFSFTTQDQRSSEHPLIGHDEAPKFIAMAFRIDNAPAISPMFKEFVHNNLIGVGLIEPLEEYNPQEMIKALYTCLDWIAQQVEQKVTIL